MSFQHAVVLDLRRGVAQSSVAGQHRRLSAAVRNRTRVVVGECPHMDGEAKKTTFQLVLIKPTHYDDDGYPITWLRSHIPSNTLAALYGLGEDCRQRQALGPDVDIVIKPIRRDQHARPAGPHHCRHQARGRQGPDLPGRRAVQPVPARHRPGAPLPHGRSAGGDGRLPCRRLPVDAAGRAARDPGGHGHGHLDLSPARPRKTVSTRSCATPGTAR